MNAFLLVFVVASPPQVMLPEAPPQVMLPARGCTCGDSCRCLPGNDCGCGGAAKARFWSSRANTGGAPVGRAVPTTPWQVAPPAIPFTAPIPAYTTTWPAWQVVAPPTPAWGPPMMFGSFGGGFRGGRGSGC